MKLISVCALAFGLFSSACSSVEVVTSTASSNGDGGGGTTTTTSTTLTSSSTSTTTTTTTSSDGGWGAGGEGGAGGAVSSVATFSLAADPAFSVIVKKSWNEPVVGIVIMTGDEAVVVPSMTLTGQAEIAGSGCSFGEQCAREALSTRVTSFSLWNGSTQIGIAQAPEPTTGKATIMGMNVMIPANSSITFTVRASFGGTASSVAPYDHMSVGVENAWDVVVLDAAQQSVLGSLESDLQGQTGTTPTVEHELRNSGDVLITSDSAPVSTIVVPENAFWLPFASFKATVHYEGASIDRLSMKITSSYAYDPSDVAQVAIASGGSIHGTAIIPVSGVVDVDLSQAPIIVPKDGEVNFQIWAKVSPVVPWSASPALSGLPRSGHAFELTLSSGITTGEWDSAYSGNLNVRTTGQTSGERLYAADAPLEVNPMVVRKSKPTIVKQSLASTELANTDVDMIRWQTAADAAGPVAVKHFGFAVQKSGTFTAQNFRLRRGASDMPAGDYRISVYDLNTIGNGIGASQWSVYVTVDFTNKEVISNSGYVYTLHATMSGVSSGDSLSIQFSQAGFHNWTTDCLMEQQPGFNYQPNFISLTNEAIVWSDESEIPNSSALCGNGGSVDWTRSSLVDGLDAQETLAI